MMEAKHENAALKGQDDGQIDAECLKCNWIKATTARPRESGKFIVSRHVLDFLLASYLDLLDAILLKL